MLRTVPLARETYVLTALLIVTDKAAHSAAPPLSFTERAAVNQGSGVQSDSCRRVTSLWQLRHVMGLLCLCSFPDLCSSGVESDPEILDVFKVSETLGRSRFEAGSLSSPLCWRTAFPYLEC